MPTPQRSARPIRRVAVLAVPGVLPFEFGVAWEGFGIDRSDEGIPPYECLLVAPTRSVRVGGLGDFTINTRHGLDEAADADLVVVPAYDRKRHHRRHHGRA